MSVLEIADYALAPGVSEAEFLATRPAMEAWLRAQPGFQSLRLVRDGTRWMDLCEWQDLASAQAASVVQHSSDGPSRSPYRGKKWSQV